MKIVYVYADNPREWNCSEWRCAVPARAVNRTGLHTAELLNMNEFAYNTPRAQEVCVPADVIVVERNLFGPVLTAIQHWKARDKVLIADFDDAYHVMPPTNPDYAFWKQGVVRTANGQTIQIEPPPLDQFRWGLRLVHAATVPSRRLLEDWSDYTRMQYVPSYLDLEKYRNITPEAHEGIIIGWGGSVTHLQRFADSGVFAALQRVCNARSQVKVMICGNDRKILDTLNVREEQIIQQPWVHYNEPARVLSRLDIGLAPLMGAYDERRSWVKVLEYMVMQIPWVASEGPAYSDLRAYGWLVANTDNAWERVLLDMVDHLDDYKAEAAREPFLYGLGQNIDDHIEYVLSMYSGIAGLVL